MKTRFPIVLAFTAIVGSGVAWAVTPEPTPASQQPSTEKTESNHNHEHEPPHLTAEDRAAFQDARIAALHAGLKLTPEQEKLWPPVETALRNAIKTLGELHKQRHEEQEDKTRPHNPIAFLRHLSDIELAHGNAAKDIANAGSPLYDSLTPEQKHRLPILLHALRRSWAREYFFLMGGPGPWHHEHEHDYDHDHEDHKHGGDHDHEHHNDHDDEE